MFQNIGDQLIHNQKHVLGFLLPDQNTDNHKQTLGSPEHSITKCMTAAQISPPPTLLSTFQRPPQHLLSMYFQYVAANAMLQIGVLGVLPESLGYSFWIISYELCILSLFAQMSALAYLSILCWVQVDLLADILNNG